MSDNAITFELAAYLHQINHKSTRTVMCESDLALATDIITLLRDKGWLQGEVKDEDHRRA